MAVPTINADITEASGTGTTITLVEPASTADNDSLYVVICTNAAGAIVVPSGWTQLYTDTQTNLGSSVRLCILIKHRITATAQGNHTFTIPSATYHAVMIALRSGNSCESLGVSVTSSAVTATTDPVTGPGITTVREALVITACGVTDDAETGAPLIVDAAQGYTERLNAAPGDVLVWVGTDPVGTPGAVTDPTLSTQGAVAEDWTWCTIEVHDAWIYCDAAIGSSGNGSTEGTAKKTIQEAANIVQAGDKIWVKSALYAELVTLPHNGDSTLPTVVEGYGTSTGDGTRASITGSDSRATCVTITAAASEYYVFKNMTFTSTTSHAFSNANADYLVFKNCLFTLAAASMHGCLVDNYCTFEQCEFTSNGDDGLHADTYTTCVGCTFDNNTGDGLQIIDGCAYGCEFYSNSVGTRITGSDGVYLLNNLFDGDNNTQVVGAYLTAGTPNGYTALNNIFFETGNGANAALRLGNADPGDLAICRNNVMNGNLVNYLNARTHTTPAGVATEVTTKPTWTDETSLDYRLTKSDTTTVRAGFDAADVCGYSKGMDIGAQQRDDS